LFSYKEFVTSNGFLVTCSWFTHSRYIPSVKSMHTRKLESRPLSMVKWNVTAVEKRLDTR